MMIMMMMMPTMKSVFGKRAEMMSDSRVSVIRFDWIVNCFAMNSLAMNLGTLFESC